LVLLTCVDIGPWMHGNADVLMSHIVSSERTSRLPACFMYCYSVSWMFSLLCNYFWLFVNFVWYVVLFNRWLH